MQPTHAEDMGSVRNAVRAAAWAGSRLTSAQCEQLERYQRWLKEEAVIAGGVGPNEVSRLWMRHIGDSLLFGAALNDASSCVDIGTGVGLPGIPLAIAWPNVSIDLVDKSGRRCDLVRRAIRVLRLENCRVFHSDVDRLTASWEAVVSRAAITLEPLLIHVKQLLSAGGVGLIGLTREAMPTPPALPSPPAGLALSVVSVPEEILDRPIQLLRIDTT